MRTTAALFLGLTLTALAPTAWGQRRLPAVPEGQVSELRLSGGVGHGESAFAARVLAERGEDEVVLLDFETSGGSLEALVSLRDAVLLAKATTVCWVRRQALGASAMVALACDVVVVAKNARVGALGAPAGSASFLADELARSAKATRRPEPAARTLAEPPRAADGAQLFSLGLADVEADTADAMWNALGRRAPSQVHHPLPSVVEVLAGLLTHPFVSTLLMVLGLLGVLIELVHPMGGKALLLGLTSLAVFFLGHHVLALAGWEELLLFAAGLGLIAYDVLHHTHGAAGSIGLTMVLAALAMAQTNLTLPLSVAWSSGALPRVLGTVFGAVLIAFGLYVAAFRFLPETRLGKRLILQAVVASPPPPPPTLLALLGHAGTALTDLRPEGRIEVLGQRHEARLEHGHANAGAPVRVVAVDGQRLVVAEEASPAKDDLSQPG